MRTTELTQPHFVLVMGGAGSGKNHYIETHYPSYVLVDVDVLKKEMEVSAAIKQTASDLRRAFADQKNVAHPTTGTNLKAQQNKVTAALAAGYKVTVVLIDTPASVAVKQVQQRVDQGGHDAGNIVGSNEKARENFATISAMPGVTATVFRR